MERLTIDEIIEHCGRKTRLYEQSCDVKYLETAFMGNGIKEYWEHKQVAEYLKKLKNYEGLEEQGLLLRLPCKVGDTIYEVSYANRKYIIREHIVNQFVYIAYRKPRIEIYCEGENGFLSSSITGQLDDGLFLNREEAEAKLAEMEGAE